MWPVAAFLFDVNWCGARPKSAVLALCKFLGAGKRVSIAHVVGATHFPGWGTAIETQLALTPKSHVMLFTV